MLVWIPQYDITKLKMRSNLFIHRFTIQLIKQGRMKGQAFVALPSEFAAKKALQDTNGYLLYDKPIVVVSFQLYTQDINMSGQRRYHRLPIIHCFQ